MRLRRAGGTVSALGLCLAVSPAGAQVPDGPEFQVNSYTTGAQDRPSVAVAADGAFVVVWESDGSPGNDSSQESIQGQRYAANGSPQGAQFQVNSYTTYFQSSPDVALAADGGFVVVWESNGSGGTDDSSRSIQGQRFAADASPQGAQFQVNSYGTGNQTSPAVAITANGDFVVAWDSDGSPGTDSSDASIQAQRFAANGSPQGAQFQVNTYTTSYQYAPSVAAASDGDFVVVWESYGSYGDSDGGSIQAQRYASDGSLQGGQFQVNTYTTSSQIGPQVAAGEDGSFVVAFRSEGSFGTDTDGSSTQARRYGANGSPQGAEIQVNTYTTAPQRFTVVAAKANGEFVVGWVSDASPGTDSSYRSIQARQFGPGGLPLGSQFQVNTYTTDTQNFPAIATNDDQFVVVWQSPGSSGTDSSDTSIQAQRYLPEPEASIALVAGLAVLLALRARRR
jgi:hypothetical protein